MDKHELQHQVDRLYTERAIKVACIRSAEIDYSRHNDRVYLSMIADWRRECTSIELEINGLYKQMYHEMTQ